MRFDQLAHVIGAAANVVGEDEIVVVGSQAILGTRHDAPEPLLRSMEADVYPLNRPDKADAIDGALGDGSQFHRTYGYYAHGVGPETAKAPAGWEERLVRVPMEARAGSSRAPVALCLEAHDLVLAKCVAGREQDWEFAGEAMRAGLVETQRLLGLLADLPVDRPARARVREMVEGLAGSSSESSD
jgi:hypothetical protein